MRGKVKIGQYECALVQDHPRLCGEKSPASPHKPMTPGSPPPMRGKVECFTGNRLAIHIEWDHPRLCGEKAEAVQEDKLRYGSPPPMRGKVKVR